MKLKRVMIAMLISILVLNVVLWDKVMAEKYLGQQILIGQEYKAFVFYCMLSCVDFMGEKGMQFYFHKNVVHATER